jgi:hypothetical protein
LLGWYRAEQVTQATNNLVDELVHRAFVVAGADRGGGELGLRELVGQIGLGRSPLEFGRHLAQQPVDVVPVVALVISDPGEGRRADPGREVSSR